MAWATLAEMKSLKESKSNLDIVPGRLENLRRVVGGGGVYDLDFGSFKSRIGREDIIERDSSMGQTTPH